MNYIIIIGHEEQRLEVDGSTIKKLEAELVETKKKNSEQQLEIKTATSLNKELIGYSL